MGREPNGSLHRTEEVDTAEAEEQRQDQILSLAPRAVGSATQFFQRQEQERRAETRQRQKDQTVRHTLRGPEQRDQRKQEQRREGREDDVVTPRKPSEVVISCIRRWRSAEIQTSRKPSFRQ
jgi:hypothetical protein